MHGQAAQTWIFSMDMDMLHGLRHAAWTLKCSMSMDMDMLLVVNIVLFKAFYNIILTFTVLPVSRPPVMVALTFCSVFFLSDN
jgi:hypothetical protein